MLKLIIPLLLAGCAIPGGLEHMQATYSKNGQALKTELVATGNHDSVSVDSLVLVAHCTQLQCDHITLTHNHPGRYYAHASQIDLDNAYKFNEIMKPLNVATDFVIIAEKDCERLAWEAAGNALDSTVQMAHDEAFERKERQILADPIGLLPNDGQVLSGEWSGKNSETPYKGPNARQAYDTVMATCNKS
jgi:hypothetical protein